MSPMVEFRPHAASVPASTSAGRWLEVLSHTDPKYGGLSAAVPALGRHLAEAAGLDISMAAFCLPGEAFEPAGYSKEQLSFWPARRTSWLSHPFRPTQQPLFADLLRTCDGVHIHGLWEGSTMLAAAASRKHGVPYVLSAHGMLEPWALQSGRLKKLVYSSFIERPNVRGAACLHALTHSEAEQFVRFGARSPIAIIPNGVDIPARKEAALFLNRFPELRGKRLVLFLARLHRKKGLELLIEAWSAVASTCPEAHLVLAGPDCEGTQAAMERMTGARGIENSVTFTGMLQEAFKWSALAAAESFVLPSYSEGLSVSVLEAMGMGLPVILTKACNMPEVAEMQAGWQIEPTAAALTKAFDALLANSPKNNSEIGARGAQLIQSQYTWQKVASKMAALYAWVEGGETPTTFQMVRP